MYSNTDKRNSGKKKTQLNPLTFLLQAAFITERTGFILAVTFPFDGVF